MERVDQAVPQLVRARRQAARWRSAYDGALRGAVEQEAAHRRLQQGIVDVETRATRRAILAAFRRGLYTDPATLVSEDLLTIADRSVVFEAIIVAARGIGGADACDLQTYDPRTGSLRIVNQRGLSPAFLDYFANVDATIPSACGTALETGEPVLVNDIDASPVFVGQPTRRVLFAAGYRAVHSYPLRDDRDGLVGMLSLHYHANGRHARQDDLARAAGRAMTHLIETGGFGRRTPHAPP